MTLHEDEFQRAGMVLNVVSINATVTNSDFMDEEESEAVAERLRQLGYL